MAKYIRQERLKDAILSLFSWRGKVQSQTCQHLFPFLSLIKKAEGKRQSVAYEESDDFAFYDEYMAAGTNSKKPYFDPLTRLQRIATHPHSNVATARKGTFELKWKAVSSEQKNGKNYFTFADDAVDILAERALMRAGKKTRLNVIDLAVWLYRSESFSDTATAQELEAKFRAEFQMTDAEYNVLFEFQPEPDSSIFSEKVLDKSAIDSVVAELELSSDLKQPDPLIKVDNEEASTDTLIAEDDSILADVRAVLALGSSGIVFRGAPGTGKSWYAMQIALNLVGGDSSRIHRIQFHPSYGYEDFVEGFIPTEGTASGFAVTDKILLHAIEAAKATDGRVVLIVDEINRGDTARIFGELLTYIEHGWRDVSFTLRLSGRSVSVPHNLVLLATMNPHDRSITQLDMALLRRFDQLDISPSREAAINFLIESGFEAGHANLIGAWFESLQALLPYGIGHAFFKGVGDLGSLGIMWRYRMLPFCETILEFEQERLVDVTRSFDALLERIKAAGSATNGP